MRGCACRGTAGFAHVSCLAEQAKILLEEAEENNLGQEAMQSRWERWHTCSLCEQHYHGVVFCALGWACWKTYVGRPEADTARMSAMRLLGNGLGEAKLHEAALSVQETELAMKRRIGVPESEMLLVQTCLANSHARLGRDEQASNMLRNVYYGRVRLNGEQHQQTILAALNYANALLNFKRFEEGKSLLIKMIPVARRVLGISNEITLTMRWNYARALYKDDGATLDDVREAVTTLEETEQTARRVLGGANPLVGEIETSLREARAALSAGDMNSISDAVGAL